MDNLGGKSHSCTKKKEGSLIPTLRLENLAKILTECFSLYRGESEAFSQNFGKVFQT